MTDTSKSILGCSFDGLLDSCYSLTDKQWLCPSFYLADVIFPVNHTGEILAGQNAETSRVDSGLSWPPEARIDGNQPLRRLPIPIAWHLLTDSQDKEARWNMDNGANFSIAKALAAHISENLKNKTPKNEPGEIVLAIPNVLDEYGQDALLRELIFSGIGSPKNKPRLIWRPVAAALAWLNKTQDDFEDVIDKDDFILVIYVGADAVELTCFRLRTRSDKSNRYVIPLRESPKKSIQYRGYDWASVIIDSLVGCDDHAGFWQAFTGFPEIWMALAGMKWDQNNLPRLWNRDNRWTLWNPDQKLRENAGKIEVKKSQILHSILRNSSKREPSTPPNLSWSDYLALEIKESLRTYSGKLRGVIFSGPLASENLANHLVPIIEATTGNNRNNLDSFEQPKVDGYWLSTNDAISEGAAIYGSRLANGEPTYLDTLVQLYTYASNRGKHQWVPLLREKELEVLGGAKHSNTLKRQFQLAVGSRNLQVLLKKGESNKFKKADFLFPNAPHENVALDLQILMSPASGLAQLEFIPEKREFIGNRRVFLDYSLMQETSEEEPKPELGFPDIIDNNIDTEDRVFNLDIFRETCNNFLRTQTTDSKYQDTVESIRNIIKRPVSYFDQSKRKWINAKLLSKDGKPSKPENVEILNKLAAKLESDFISVTKKQTNQDEKTVKFLWQTCSWLYDGTPKVIKDYICTVLQSTTRSSNVHLAEAAGRCFTDPIQMRTLYASIHRGISERLRENNATKTSFPLQYMRALWNILQFRDYAPDALDKAQAGLIAQQTITLMNECVRNKNFKVKFFQATRLFIFLLRYRLVDRAFMTSDNTNDGPLFKQAINCLESAKDYFQQMNTRNTKAQDLMEELVKYMNYKGTMNIVDILNQVDGEDEGENDETS